MRIDVKDRYCPPKNAPALCQRTSEKSASFCQSENLDRRDLGVVPDALKFQIEQSVSDARFERPLVGGRKSGTERLIPGNGHLLFRQNIQDPAFRWMKMDLGKMHNDTVPARWKRYLIAPFLPGPISIEPALGLIQGIIVGV